MSISRALLAIGLLVSSLEYQSAKGASFVPITSDADSGIAASLTYTHTIDFLDFGESPAAINSVVFTGEFAGAGGVYEAAGTEDDAGGQVENIGATGDIAQLLDGFLFNNGGSSGDISTITLGGLVVGQTYDVRLYTRTWEPDEDRTTFISFDTGFGAVDSLVYDQDTNPPLPSTGYITSTYSALTPTLTIRFEQTSDAAFHAYGITNHIVPEPSTWVLSGIGAMVAILFTASRRRGSRIALRSTASRRDHSGGWKRHSMTAVSCVLVFGSISETLHAAMVAPPVIYQISLRYGETDFGWTPITRQYTAFDDAVDFQDRYLAVNSRIAPGGSHVELSVTTTGPQIELDRREFLTWTVGSPPLGIDFGWPRLIDQATVTAYVRGTGNTPFTSIVDGQGALMSNGPAIDLTGRLLLERGSLSVLDIRGTTPGYANNAYSGATRLMTPAIFEGNPYTLAYQFTLNAEVHQNAGYSHQTYTATAALLTTIETWINQGVAPEAILSGPGDAIVGQLVTLSSLSYDPDDGSQDAGAGIWLHRWTITGPDGFRHESDDSTALLTPSAPGLYEATLEVFDDEGMRAIATTSLAVVAVPEPSTIVLASLGLLAMPMISARHSRRRRRIVSRGEGR